MNILSTISEDAELRRLFGRFPTGVTALCVLDQGRPVGMTASAFVAISLNPHLTLGDWEEGCAFVSAPDNAGGVRRGTETHLPD